MADYRLTSNEVNLILNQAALYADLPVDLSWVPRQRVDPAYTAKAYVLTEIPPPKGSRDGSLSMGTLTARTETTANAIWWRYRMEIPYVDVVTARRNGYAIIQDNVRVYINKMQKKIAQLVFQGTSGGDDVIAINGMLDSGEDVDAGLDDNYWNTAGEPYNHALEGVKDLIDNKYAPPFTWIMSWDLFPGLTAKHNAAVDTTSMELIRGATWVNNFVFAEGGTDSGFNIYPLPAATTDDGVWIMTKPSSENYLLLEMTNGIETWLNPELNRDKMLYEGYVQWAGTFIIKKAGSIVYEPDVDLVA